MNLVPLNDIFNIKYGNQFDLYKLDVEANAEINFVSRSSQNLGVVAKVNLLKDVAPFDAGLITVTLGGTYLLSSFVQQSKFYTAQNIKVLEPKVEMSFGEKIFYCKAIEANRFRYTSHGREANISLNTLLVPKYNGECENILNKDLYSNLSKPLNDEKINLQDRVWKWFKYRNLFEIERGRGPRKQDLGNGTVPFITSSDQDNGLTGFTDSEPTHKGNVITVTRNGSVAEVFYQPIPFCSTEDVHIFNPKFKMNVFIVFFIIPLIRKEKYRYSYGRKWGINRMNESLIKLPTNVNGEPDYDFMEQYIKTLHYSSSV